MRVFADPEAPASWGLDRIDDREGTDGSYSAEQEGEGTVAESYVSAVIYLSPAE